MRLSALALTGLLASTALAQAPYGLESRPPIGVYLNNRMPPSPTAFAFPQLLSATGAFRDLQTLTPAEGVIPFTVNSPLWSDGAVKSRWMAIPNDGPPYTAGEQIGFAPVGEWSFPDGTVFVKHFEMVVNEATGERRRLETRLLVRTPEGRYGVTYKWRPDNSDADLLADGLEEDLTITNASGAIRTQRYSYPSRSDCLFCHNQQANYVLGPKTHQLNGNFSYPETGKTDNQLRTLNHLGLLNPAQNEANFATYLRSVSVTSTTASVQHRMRSWIDANCSHCHRPGGFGPGYDGRFYTPLQHQNLINNYVNFRDLEGSLLYQRDNALDEFKMPPIAKNVVHQAAMATLRQWIASPLEVLSITLYRDTAHLAVRFNSHVDPETALTLANYSLDGGVAVTDARMSSKPDTVILTAAGLVQQQSYTLTLNDITDTAQSANTIWPGSMKPFAAKFPALPADGRIANISTRVQVNGNDRVLIAGFIATGGSKRVMLRAIVPSLASSGITGALENPVLELYDNNGVLLDANDDWEQNANRQEIVDTGIAPASPTESAILRILPSGASTAYTAVVRSASGAPGVALVEAYDLDTGAESQLANTSTRGEVQSGENVMVGGLIVRGPSARRVILRGLGPSLPVAGALGNPTLEVFDANGASIGSNDNWRSNQEAEIISTGLQPSSDSESAILTRLAPNVYTAVMRGVAGAVGVGLLELYALQ
ncbi:hypothetical protein BH18VER1_BH18VER1_21690 [soil metagenome]